MQTTAKTFLKHLYTHSTSLLNHCFAACTELRACKGQHTDALANDLSFCTLKEINVIIALSKEIYLKKNMQELKTCVESLRSVVEAVITSSVASFGGGNMDKEKLDTAMKGLQIDLTSVFESQLPDATKDITTMANVSKMSRNERKGRK